VALKLSARDNQFCIVSRNSQSGELVKDNRWNKCKSDGSAGKRQGRNYPRRWNMNVFAIPFF